MVMKISNFKQFATVYKHEVEAANHSLQFDMHACAFYFISFTCAYTYVQLFLLIVIIGYYYTVNQKYEVYVKEV